MDVNNREVTFFITALEGGGAEAVCVNVANGLAERGWNVTLVVLHLNKAAYLDRISPLVRLNVLEVEYVRHAFFALHNYLRRNGVKNAVVFNYELTVMMVMVRSVGFYKFRLIARNINTLSEARKRSKGFWRKHVVSRLIDKFYCKADFIVNQCKGMQRDIVELYGVDKSKAPVIYNPVNQRVEEISRSLKWDEIGKQDYFLCVGRLDQQKAFHYAIEAFAAIAHDFPDMRLKIVGRGVLGGYLKEVARDFDIQDRVDFESFQDDIVPFYLGAKATVLTSLYEGFPNVLIESITLGTPVIAFDCKSGPNEIINNDNGILVEYLSTEGLISAMRLINSGFTAEQVHASAAPFEMRHALDAYEELLS
nr:glycosyltransferase [Halomonas socia]